MKNNMILTLLVGGIIGIFVIFRKMIKRDLIISVIIKNEGGYVNDPDDKGGETKYGITRYRYPDLDIKNLTKKEAAKIYERDFYVPMQIGKMTNINLALQYIDTAVNALSIEGGIKRAKSFLKKAIERSDVTPGLSVLEAYKEIRKEFYTNLANTTPVYQKYLKGWLARVDKTKIA